MHPADVAPIPIKWLFGPAIALAFAALFFGVTVLSDGGFLNAHGAGVVGVMVFAVTALVTAVLELVAIAVTLGSMLRAPSLRTKRNILAVFVGTIPIVIAGVLLASMERMR